MRKGSSFTTKKAAIHSSTTGQEHERPGSTASSKTHWVKWLLYCVVAVLGSYRLMTFVPQPLDSSTTLRALLYPWFAAFIQRYSSPEQAMSAWRTYALFASFVPVILALLNYFSNCSIPGFNLPERARRVLGSRSLLWATIAGCLAMWRYPILLLNELNPDETQFIVSARKLFRDPLFFRSVDCGTSGPLNIYPLMLPAILGLSPDYAASRLVGLVIIFLSMYTLYRAFALVAPEHLARIALLPLIGIFSLLNYSDLVHYSSEHVSLLILSLSIYTFFRLLRDGQSCMAPMCMLGFLTAAAFFAKMQAVPLVLAVDAVALAFLHTSTRVKPFWRPTVALLGGAAPLPLMIAAVCVAAGQWENFWITYVLGNRRYVDVGYGAGFASYSPAFVHFVFSYAEIRVFIFTLLAALAAYLYLSPRLALPAGTVAFIRMAALSVTVLAACTFLQSQVIDYSYVAIALMFVVAAFLFLLYTHKTPAMHLRLWVGLLASALVASSLFAVYAAHRFFPHYLLLLIIPLGFAMACLLILNREGDETASTGGLDERARIRANQSSELPFVLIFVTLCLTFQTGLAISVSGIGPGLTSPSLRVPESDFISSVTPPAGEIVVWGWNARPYLGAGRDPATRDTNMANFFLSAEGIKGYYRRRFLNDLQSHPAVLFIDGAGPNSCCSFDQRKDVGFELIPDIKAFIQSNYVYVMRAYGERFYIRRDLASQTAGISPSKPCSADAIRCLDDALAGAALDLQNPLTLAPIQMPQHALLEAQFTPETNQDPYATVFSNEAASGSGQGFQFQHLGSDEYRLVVGLGGGLWAFSRPMTLPQRKPASLSIELNTSRVTIVLNGTKIDEMDLSHSLVDSPGEIVLGSWIGGQRAFRGHVQSFQIRDLAKKR